MNPNGIAGYIAGWFGSIPAGLFLPLATQGNKIVVDTAAIDHAAVDKAKQWLDVAIAIVLAESGGDTHAVNPSGAKGLWQIMMPLHAALVNDGITAVNAEYGTDNNSPKNLDVFDPRVNTFVAGQLYGARGWQPWEAYTTGAYKAHLGHGTAAFNFLNSPHFRHKQWSRYQANAIDNASYTAIAAMPGDALNSLSPSNVLDWVKGMALPAGVFLVALVLVVVGLIVVLESSKTGRTVTKAALP